MAITPELHAKVLGNCAERIERIERNVLPAVEGVVVPRVGWWRWVGHEHGREQDSAAVGEERFELESWFDEVLSDFDAGDKVNRGAIPLTTLREEIGSVAIAPVGLDPCIA